MNLPGSLTWRQLLVGSLAFGLVASVIPLGLRALVLETWWALVDGAALVFVAVFSLGAAVFQLVGGAAEARAWLRHWIFGTIVAYFGLWLPATLWFGVDAHNIEIKPWFWLLSAVVGASNILIMRAWLAREKTGSNH